MSDPHPLAFLERLCQIPPAQEEYLRHCPTLHPDDSPNYSITTEHRALLDTLLNPSDKPSQSPPCTRGKALQTDDVPSMVDPTMVAGTSRANCGVSENEKSYQIAGRDLSQNDSPPGKRMKISHTQAYSGTEPMEIGDNLQKCPSKCVENTECREVNPEAEKFVCNDEGREEVNEVGETSDEISVDVLEEVKRIADRVKDMTKGKSEDEKAESFVFDVLKAIAEEEKASKKKYSLENVSFLEIAISKGFKFPIPLWWRVDFGP